MSVGTRRLSAGRIGLLLLAVCILGVVGVRVLDPLPPLSGRTESTFLADTADTTLGRALTPRVEAHPGQSGIAPLATGREAFAARMLLASAAERSIDAQYYIWNGDNTGTLMFDALREAAERGVRVRLLLDDNNTRGLDDVLGALDAHPMIEIRLFNPFVFRGMRWLGFVTDFRRLNRRMHNKSFTVDNQATIVGGRNVADEYFDAVPRGELVFADLDVLAVGSIVTEVSQDFDRYWASGSSYPAARLLPEPADSGLAQLRARADSVRQSPAAVRYVSAVRELPFVSQLVGESLPLEWAEVRMVSDDPAKGLGRAAPEAMLPAKLADAMGEPMTSVEVVSPYFVPTAKGVESFAALEESGVHVRVLVNSLAATDVIAVHSGYIKHRHALLRAGILLYEMRLVSRPSTEGISGLLGSGAASLHAKTFAADRRRIFIGSFNFDPRSANLNTELGFVIESEAIAGRLATMFDEAVPAFAYEVRLSPEGEVYWLERSGEATVRHDVEPDTTAVQRLAVRVLSWLPIDSLL